jgi:hypothetical protein
MTPKTQQHKPRAERIRLIIELRKAHRRLEDLVQEYRDGPLPTLASFVLAKRRLSAMNRDLALATLEAARLSLSA